MSPLVTLLVMALVTQCWSAPQWRNWTPQAILYLKGTQGRCSVLERTDREESDTLHFERETQSRAGSSLSSILLRFVQQAMEEGAANPDNSPDEQQMRYF